jgi:hypothetical protein
MILTLMRPGMEPDPVCPRPECQHPLDLHDATMSASGSDVLLLCKVCLSEGVGRPWCARLEA